jgi:hypothetical protein
VNNNYIVIVSNVTDVSPRHNVIAPNSMFPIRSLVTLVDMNGAWRYYDPYPPFDQEDLGTAWRQLNYTEVGSWGDGASIFWLNDPSAIPGEPGATLSQTPGLITYFRKGFNFQASRGGLKLYLTHIIDDGAVLYLNGAEEFRFNMPSPVVSYNTPASPAVGDPSRIGPIEVPANGIIAGSNVVAVELHQVQNVDVDKAFGMQLDASVQSFVVGPVVIVRAPADVTVPEGASATFDVIQVGGARFQWYSNAAPSTPIANATNSTYTIPAVTLGMNGATFRVLVTNGLSGPTAGGVSGVATLHVVADTNAPAIVSAKLGANNTTIVLSFTEPMAAAAANNRLNYTVTNSSGASAVVSSAALSNGTNVVLTFGSQLAGLYTVVVNNLTDTATTPNSIAPNSAVTVGADYFIAMNSAWKYLLANTNDAVETAFKAVNYDDSSWRGPSNALVYVEDAALPGPKSTEISLFADAANTERINTFYFRQKFVAPISSSSVVLHIRHIIDDGVVLYLNGVEVFRFNMPTTPPTASSQASTALGDAALVGPLDITVANLIAGTNVLAAEVHQNGATSSDVVFGIEVSASIPSVVIPAPASVQILNQPQSRTNNVGTVASFSVVAAGATPLFYQWQKDSNNIPGATASTYTINSVTQNDAASYRVIVSNAFSTAVSQAAILTVAGGTCTSQPPALSAQHSATNVVLSWTNPIDSCGTTVPYILRSTTALPTPPALGTWTTNAVSSPYTVAPTNTARFFQLIRQ